MSHELRGELEFERAQIHLLLSTYGPLLQRMNDDSPRPEQVLATASVIHSFYNGVEGILKRIAHTIDGERPVGPNWHKSLLESMSRPTAARGPVLDEALAARLSEYLAFLHLFRTHYSHMLDWNRIRPLARNLPATAAEFDAALAEFMATFASERG